jgi:hypothetical protein
MKQFDKVLIRSTNPNLKPEEWFFFEQNGNFVTLRLPFSDSEEDLQKMKEGVNYHQLITDSKRIIE